MHKGVSNADPQVVRKRLDQVVRTHFAIQHGTPSVCGRVQLLEIAQTGRKPGGALQAFGPPPRTRLTPRSHPKSSPARTHIRSPSPAQTHIRSSCRIHASLEGTRAVTGAGIEAARRVPISASVQCQIDVIGRDGRLHQHSNRLPVRPSADIKQARLPRNSGTHIDTTCHLAWPESAIYMWPRQTRFAHHHVRFLCSSVHHLGHDREI